MFVSVIHKALSCEPQRDTMNHHHSQAQDFSFREGRGSSSHPSRAENCIGSPARLGLRMQQEHAERLYSSNHPFIKILHEPKLGSAGLSALLAKRPSQGHVSSNYPGPALPKFYTHHTPAVAQPVPKPMPPLRWGISSCARQGALRVCLSWWEAHLCPQHRRTFALEPLLFPFQDACKGPRLPFSAQERDKAHSKRQ